MQTVLGLIGSALKRAVGCLSVETMKRNRSILRNTLKNFLSHINVKRGRRLKKRKKKKSHINVIEKKDPNMDIDRFSLSYS